MSDCCKPSEPSTRVPARKCFWYSQGKCFLTQEGVEEMVYEIMASNPQAKEDLLKCAEDDHCYVPQEYFEFAIKDVTIRDTQYDSDRFQRHLNPYVDNHRNIQFDEFRKPEGSDE